MAREPVSADEELARLRPVLADVVALGMPVSIDSMKAAVVGLGARCRAPPSPTTSGACSAIPTWPTLVAARGVPVIVMHNRDRADPGIDIMQDIAAFFARSLEIAAKAGIATRQHRARSRHRLRQDAASRA